MVYGSNPSRKDKPHRGISNVAETSKVPSTAQLLLITGTYTPSQRVPARSGSVVTRISDRIRTTWWIAIAAAIGLPRRVGARLYAMNDAEASWYGWQVTETRGGLGRRYRDARFGLLARDPALRRDEFRDGLAGLDAAEPAGRVPGTVAQPPGAHRGVRGVVPPGNSCPASGGL